MNLLKILTVVFLVLAILSCKNKYPVDQDFEFTKDNHIIHSVYYETNKNQLKYKSTYICDSWEFVYKYDTLKFTQYNMDSLVKDGIHEEYFENGMIKGKLMFHKNSIVGIGKYWDGYGNYELVKVFDSAYFPIYTFSVEKNTENIKMSKFIKTYHKNNSLYINFMTPSFDKKTVSYILYTVQSGIYKKVYETSTRARFLTLKINEDAYYSLVCSMRSLDSKKVLTDSLQFYTKNFEFNLNEDW